MRDRFRHRLATAILLGILNSVSLAGPADLRGLNETCQEKAELVSRLELWLENLTGPAPYLEWLLAQVKKDVSDNCVRLNEIQVLGTHNSYHVQPREPFFSILLGLTPAVLAWEYTHLPADGQLASQGIRQLELDVFADPDGGRYFLRAGRALLGLSPLGPLALLAPGMKVLHVQHLDFETTCVGLVACLETVKTWSDQNSSHLPLMILIEAKDDPLLGGGNPNIEPIPFGADEFDALDTEIRSVFPEERLFTPDDLRGGHPTLEAAVLLDGWPTLGVLRGQVLFTLDNGGTKRDIYLQGHPSLEGRVMFTNSAPGQADAAFVKVNDPLNDPTRIPSLVEAGYLVRTWADANTWEARSGDTTRRDTALASGAHFVSTDFPEPNAGPGFTDYFVEIPGGFPARCNPVLIVPGCRNEALEDLN